MLRRIAISALILFILAACQSALAEGPTQYARFQFGNRSATFHSAEKTIAASDSIRSGELAEMYRGLSGKEWTTEREASGGVLEFAFLNALAQQGWEVLQVNYVEGASLYLLKKQK